MPFLETILLSASNSKSRVSFPDAPLFRIIYFLSDLFISNAHVLFHFLSLNTVQNYTFPFSILKWQSRRCTFRIHLKTCGRKLNSSPFVFEKNEHRFDLKTKVFKYATYERYVLAKLSRFDQISTQISSDCCLQRILRKLK